MVMRTIALRKPAIVYQLFYSNCYIANAKTKRNWLIRGHVALDKCNVSLGKQVKNCCPATNIKKTKWRRNSQV